jgi:hypothetical protein
VTPAYIREGATGRRTFAVVISVGICAGILLYTYSLTQPRGPVLAKWTSIAVGDQEVEVRRRLGQPTYEYSEEPENGNYYVPGYGKHVRPITGKVLIYREFDLVFYVWIDPGGLVEGVFIGRD